MSARSKKLTAAFTRTIDKPGKYHDGNGAGLYLKVSKTGAKNWVQRLTIRGKRKELGLGGMNVISLADARATALDNKRVAVLGGDPLAEKRKAKSILSFAETARLAHKELSPTWKNPKDGAAFLKTLETYLFPAIGHIAINEINSADIRQPILEARKRAPEVARKLTYRVSAVFRYAIAEGMRTDNPATADSLALPRNERKVEHRKALHYRDVGAFLNTLKASGANLSTKLALELLVLTASRSGEVRMADWSEFDLDEAIWIIPAERMKSKREHRVPLSERAIEVLNEAKALGQKGGLVFPGTKHSKPLSDMTLSKLVRELGYDAHVHGFRTSFKTWAQEQTNSPREVSEAALAHVVQNKAEAAYARSDFFDKRRKLIDRWCSYLEAECKILQFSSGTVVV